MNEEKEFNIYKYIGVQTDSATITELVDYAYELEQQLQAYKDKEDKIREYISELSGEEILLAQGFEPMYVNGIIFAYEITKEDILQILNEGDK